MQSSARLVMSTDRKNWQRKGYGEEDYREAVEKRGTMQGAADELGVSRTTVREMCVRHGIEVESVGGVPNPLPSDQSD